MDMASRQAVDPLPEELVRDILERAARSSKSTAANLCFVNSTVRRWVSPILYDVVILDTGIQLQSFLRSRLCRTARAVSITQPAIMHIDPDDWPNYIMILGAYTLRVPMTLVGLFGAAQLRSLMRTRRLYLASQYPNALTDLDAATIWRLQRESDFGIVCPPEMLDATFSGVTHLFAELDVVTAAHFVDLVCHAAPVITHLGFSYQSDASGLLGITVSCAFDVVYRLERLYVRCVRTGDDLNQTHEASLAAMRAAILSSDALPAVRDGRVFIDVCAGKNFAEDSLWERDARGELDIWSIGVPLVP